MKKRLLILLITGVSFALHGQNKTQNTADFLSRSDAEMVLGQTAIMIESFTSNKNGVIQSRYTYTATTRDEVTRKLGKVYCLFERFTGAEECEKAYEGIVESNDGASGFTLLDSIGDEALFHTESSNFALIVARQKKMLRIKVNKLTSTTSIPELKGLSPD